jgi:hypothetical protein
VNPSVPAKSVKEGTGAMGARQSRQGLRLAGTPPQLIAAPFTDSLNLDLSACKK